MPAESPLRAIAAKLRRYREDIVLFVREQFQVEPDPWQVEALRMFASERPEHRRISLQACVGPGKTTVLAWCGWHFLGCQGEKGEHPKGAAVSITADNLNSNLWPELAKWQARSPYLRSRFTWGATRIVANDHPETWFLDARSWPKTANAEEQGKTLSGLHSRYVLSLIDESGAIPLSVLRAAEQSLSNTTFGKIMQAGNPISTYGMLYAASTTLREQWQVIAVTGDPDDPNRAPRVDLAWAKQQIALYGRDNPWVRSYILGLFPTQAFNTLIGVEEVEAAMRRHLRAPDYEWAQKRLGVDVARFGDDRSVIFPRQGLAAFRPVVLRMARTTDIAARVAQAMADWHAATALIDDTGHWGHGVIDNLLAAQLPALGITMSDPAIDPRYRNRRAECWLQMTDWIKRGGALPPIPGLIAELTEPTYTFAQGKFLLEDKDQVKRRLGRSPDLADALSLTFALPDQPADVLEQIGQGGHVAVDFDPYAAEAQA